MPLPQTQAKEQAVRDAADAIGAGGDRQILFGDLHVHTTFSADAFEASLPLNSGEGAHPPADACDFARFCAGLDFWSINDHAEASTPERWRETKESIRECNARAGDPSNPDVVAFLGWEWTQIGSNPDNHYGHKNIILRDTEEDRIPARPIAAVTGAQTFNVPLDYSAVGRAALLAPLLDPWNAKDHLAMTAFQRASFSVDRCAVDVPSPDLPLDCKEYAKTPEALFRKLDEWGHESMVIPHGNAWGLYTPPGSTWDKQLIGPQHDPNRQTLIEVYSGHGNSEEFRDWSRVGYEAGEDAICPAPEPGGDYLACCWRAGEIVEARCEAAGDSSCEEHARTARSNYVAAGASGHLTVPGARAEDWQDCSQCRDCFLPGFKHTPGASAQAALATTSFDGEEERRFRFGFIASSDNHSARPGTGYKEFARTRMVDVHGPSEEARLTKDYPVQPIPEGRYGLRPDEVRLESTKNILEMERRYSFLYTGGLVATHAAGRDRASIWDALRRNEVYGTSGPRILLWFESERPGESEAGHRSATRTETGLETRPGTRAEAQPGTRAEPRPMLRDSMGSAFETSESPLFRVRAVGAFEQRPGCPEVVTEGLSPERLARLCAGECDHPGDTRHLIDRIEVVRIRPQVAPGEDLAGLIEDPWRVFSCDADPVGCEVEFRDPDFAGEGRDAVYYVRAIQRPTPGVNGEQMRCERDALGRCSEMKLCHGGFRTSADDDCLAPVEERAWSSPIYVDFAGPAPGEEL
ncbi:MAG: DUF3604 domain-containing protein [Myxococcota bacterium]